MAKYISSVLYIFKMKNLNFYKLFFCCLTAFLFLYFLSVTRVFSQNPSAQLSPDFTGIWESIPSKTVIINGSTLPGYRKIIRLRLCIRNGILEGIISHSRIKGLEKFDIDSQEIISATQVSLGLKDRLGRKALLTLFIEDGVLKGRFKDENINFIAKLQNSFKRENSCELSNIDVGLNNNTSSSSGTIALSTDFNGIWKSKPLDKVNINSLDLPGIKKPLIVNLCIEDGILKGVFSSTGILQGANIISQLIVSSNQVNVELQDKFGATDSLSLILEDKKLKGLFEEGVSFIADKKSSKDSIKSCMIKEPLVPANPIFD